MGRRFYFPPCNCCFGSMGDGFRVSCMGPPSHKGDHYDSDEGMRWNGYGRKVRACTRRACADPFGVLVSPDGTDRVHLCPGGNAERQFKDTLIAEGWTRGE